MTSYIPNVFLVCILPLWFLSKMNFWGIKDKIATAFFHTKKCLGEKGSKGRKTYQDDTSASLKHLKNGVNPSSQEN